MRPIRGVGGLVGLHYQIYFLWNQEQYFINITHHPALDFRYRGGREKGYQMALLTGPLSLGSAAFLLDHIASSRERAGQEWLRRGPSALTFGGPLDQAGGGYPRMVAEKFALIRKTLTMLSRNGIPGVRPEQILREPVDYLEEKAGSVMARPGFCQAGEVLLPAYQAPGLARGRQDGAGFPLSGAGFPLAEVGAKALGILAGRLLLPGEVARALEEHRLHLPWPMEDWLHLLYLAGQAAIFPAVALGKGGRPYCTRCGQAGGIRPMECLDCGGTCLYCEECLAMGECRLCRPLFAFGAGEALAAAPGQSQGHGPARGTGSGTKAGLEYGHESEVSRDKGQGSLLHLDFALTPAQADASREAREFVRGRQGEALVWAVCGAGKTEVAFGAMEEVLRAGGKVLFAIPRRDVVKELEPRLRQAFPREEILCLYGGSSGKFREGQIVLATTHQVIRFYRAFDLVVLDEVDAFPYAGSAMLYQALRRAVKPGGKLISMTATPNAEILERARKGEVPLIRIPARHHGYPLPVPEIRIVEKLAAGRGKITLPSEVLDFLREGLEEEKAQIFVFVPTVNLAPLVAGEIAKTLALDPGDRAPDRGATPGAWIAGGRPTPVQGALTLEPVDHAPGQGDLTLPAGQVSWSHARDAERDRKGEAFRKGLVRVFVTTSIMERGITVPRAHVLVLFADEERIFDQGALIQMAGRAGRSTAYPTGRVWFVGARKTRAMTAARKAIEEMNQEAAKRGYLRKG